MPTNATTRDYDHLYDIIAKRMSIRRLNPDPIPGDYVRAVLEAGRCNVGSDSASEPS